MLPIFTHRPLLALLTLLAPLLPTAALADPPPPTDAQGRPLIKLIAFGDFRGVIVADEGPAGSPGAARLANKIKTLKDKNPLHAVISTGNLFGASPLRSARFKDEPTIEAMNSLIIDFAGMGHHEFDEGKAELLRLRWGGNHPSDPFSGKGRPGELGGQGKFIGSGFQYMAANVIDTANGQLLLDGLYHKDFEVAQIAFIGVAAKNTPSLLTPAAAAGLEFRDEANTINAQVPGAVAVGSRAIVVIAPQPVQLGTGSDPCEGMAGPLVELVGRLDPEIDLLLTAQSQRAFSCLLPNRVGRPLRVISAGAFGRELSEIDLSLDPQSRDVVAMQITAHEIGLDEPEDPELQGLLDHYAPLAATQTGTGRITAAQLGLVINLNDPYSIAVGDYYAQRRGIPAANIVRVSLPTTPTLSRAAFEPIRAEIEQRLPVGVQGIAMVWRQPYAVDCLSITAVTSMGYPPEARCADINTLMISSKVYRYTGGQPYRVKGERPSMLLAARSVDSAKALIDRGIRADFSQPAAQQRPSAKAYLISTWDAARNVRAQFFPPAGPLDPWGSAVLRSTLSSGYLQTPISEVMIYQTGLTHVDGLANIGWLPGALADHLTSYGGKLDSPPGNWQMSVLDWIESGATASYGTVTEPYNYPYKFPAGGQLLHGYMKGLSALEAYWQSVDWPLQGVFVGEPLAAPFAPLLQRLPSQPGDYWWWYQQN